MSIAVLDIGKTNVKLAVVGPGQEVLYEARRANAPLPGPPYPHHDVDGIWRWLLDALAACPRADGIDAIVTTTHGATAALMAGDDLALPVLDYEHDGVEAVTAEYDALRPAFAETASPGLPVGLNLGRQLHWLERSFPRAFAAVTDILTYPQYWSYRLSGCKATEVTSLGCHTDLWSPTGRAFSSLVEQRGWAKRMPPLRRADEVLAPVAPAVAHGTGLKPDTRIICGIHDSNASYYCHRVSREPPFTVVSSGTWTICMAAGADPARLDEDADMLANVDVFGDPVPCARFMGGREYAALAGTGGGSAVVDMDTVTGIVRQGVFALPSFAPQGGPFRERQGRVIPSMPGNADARAALGTLYCALMTDYCLDALSAAGDLIVEGSLARNPAYLSVLAALRSEQPVIASADATGTTLGAAYLAGLAPADGAGTGPTHVSSTCSDDLRGYRDRWREALASQ